MNNPIFAVPSINNTASSVNKCRTCLEETLNPTTLESLKGSFQMLEILSVLNFLNVQVIDGLALRFCTECGFKIQNILLFKKQCITANAVLQQMYGSLITKPTIFVNEHLKKPSTNLVQVNVKSENINEGNDIKTEDCNYIVVDKVKLEPEIELSTEDALDIISDQISTTDHSSVEEVKPKEEGTETIDSAFSCGKCAFQCNSKEKLEEHCQNKHDTVCTICNKKLSNTRNLRRHRQFVHQPADQPKPFCKLCGTFYNSELTLQLHNKSFHSENGRQKFICKFCGKGVFELKQHVRSQHRKKQTEPVTCTVCSKQFKSKLTLTNHIKRLHEKMKTLKSLCPICGRVYPTSGEVRTHMKYAHNEQKNHKCRHCSQMFKTTSGRNGHERRVHFDVRPYTCDICSKAFKGKIMLDRHVLIHTGEKPFVCDMCSRPFRQKASLVTHKKLVHHII